MWSPSVNTVSPFLSWLHKRPYSLKIVTSLPGRPQQLLYQRCLCLPSWIEESPMQVIAKNWGRRRWIYASGASHSTFPHISVLWSKKSTWPECDSPILFVFEYLQSLFLSYLILITQKYGSQINSICVTWELVKNTEALAPPQTYCIYISILTTGKDDSEFSWGRL